MILIVGAGLSGLLTGYLLKKEGIPFKILEARNRVGGRINTHYDSDKAPVELGATWFTPQHNLLKSLLSELDIEFFEQKMDSHVFYQASIDQPTQLVQIPNQSPSFRISGGSSNLINKLHKALDEDDLFLNQNINEIKVTNLGVEVIAKETFKSDYVVLALPPKLWANNIKFHPKIPEELMHIATRTHTWMEDSIKIGLTYDQPFWGKKGLPGTLFSNPGPITEIYDHSNHERSRYALCGFMNSSLKNQTTKECRLKIIDQLSGIFGKQAEAYSTYNECIWSQEENTYTSSDFFLGPHQNNGNPIFNSSLFEGKVLISSTEAAANFPGYMEGAVFMGRKIADQIIQAQKNSKLYRFE